MLDTNFWLATHVTCVTLGYTATFVAGFMGIAYVAAMAVTAIWRAWPAAHENCAIPRNPGIADRRGIFTHFFETDASPIMSKMIYGVVCFAHAPELHGHRAGRHLGRLVVGPLLGLGPQGERRPAHRASGAR